MSSCVVIGILPPSVDLYKCVKEKVASINDQPIQWREDYSMVEDEENNNALTLLMMGVYEEPLTHELVVEEVTKTLTTTKEQQQEQQQQQEHTQYSCELWASAPAPLPLRPLEGYANKILIQEECWETQAPATMQEYGIVQQQTILTPDQVVEIRQIVDRAIANVDSLLAKHRPNIEIGEDSFIFKEIASRNLQRFDLRLDTLPEAVEFVKRSILGHPSVDFLLQKALGSPHEIDFDVSVVYSRPGAITQKWHADGSHQKGANDAGWEVDGWKKNLASAYALCLFIPLIDLDYDTGYTQFWPGSHRHKNLVGFGPAAELAKATFDGIGAAGDGVWYDYRLLHRGMYNVSTKVRPVVQVIFKKKWYVERVNYGKESIVKS